MPNRARYLIVDGHSIIFAWPELRKLQARRSSLAREALIKRLRDYQDWTGVRVVVVFDGKGRKIEAISDPADVQVFYSRTGQTADAIIERLASKYAKQFELMVATSDSMEAETVAGVRRRMDFAPSVARAPFECASEPRVLISSQSLSRARRVFRAGGSRQSVALLLSIGPAG